MSLLQKIRDYLSRDKPTLADFKGEDGAFIEYELKPVKDERLTQELGIGGLVSEDTKRLESKL